MSSKFSLLANAIPSFNKHTTVEAKVDAIADYQVQLLDYLRYAMSNLDAENFNATGLEEILEPLVVEIKNANGDITSIKATVEGVQSTVKGHSTTINSHTNTLNSHGTSISNLSSQITQTANKISAVVSAVDDSSGNVTAASIVAAINATTGSSMVKIEADHIQMTGTTTFVSKDDLSTEGKTTINAGNITTGSISANRISGGTLSGVVLVSESGYGQDDSTVTISNGQVIIGNGNGVLTQLGYSVMLTSETGHIYIGDAEYGGSVVIWSQGYCWELGASGWTRAN